MAQSGLQDVVQTRLGAQIGMCPGIASLRLETASPRMVEYRPVIIDDHFPWRNRMNVYISADIEGVAGVTSGAETEST